MNRLRFGLLAGLLLMGSMSTTGCTSHLPGMTLLGPTTRSVTVTLGSTTEADVVRALGQPRTRSEYLAKGGKWVQLDYNTKGTGSPIMLTVVTTDGQRITNPIGTRGSKVQCSFRFIEGVLDYAG